MRTMTSPAHLAAVFNLEPVSPVLKFWTHSGPFDVYLKPAQLIMFALVIAVFVGALLIRFPEIQEVPPEEIPEAEQIAAYGEVLYR